MYKFEYSLTDSDYIKFNIFHTFNSKSGKKNMLTLRLIVPVILFFILFIPLINKENRDIIFFSSTIFIYLVSSIICFFLAKHFQIYFIKKMVKRIKKDGKLPYGKNNLIKFDQNFIYEVNDKIETKTKYTVLENIMVDDNAIYIYFSAIQAYIIPFRVFENDEQKEAFLEFINDKIKSNN